MLRSHHRYALKSVYLVGSLRPLDFPLNKLICMHILVRYLAALLSLCIGLRCHMSISIWHGWNDTDKGRPNSVLRG